MSHSATHNREGSERSLLHHRMKYSSHGNDPLASIECYTHIISSGGLENINVSVTCSRQQPALLNQHPLTSSCSDAIWKGHSTSSLSLDPSLTSQVEATHSSHQQPVSAAVFHRTIFGRGDRKKVRNMNPSAEKGKCLNSETFATHTKPYKCPKLHLSSGVGSSIAPQSMRAVVTQRLRPITSNTMIKGRAMPAVTT